MAFTLSQTRRAILVDGNINQFTIETLITDKGTMPYLEVFVYQIVTEDDPKDDIFLRVASVPDYTTITRGRDAALLDTDTTNSLLYLSASSTINYDTLDVAIAGQTAIKDRVNTLVTSWLQYDTEFEAYPTPEFTTMPTGTDDQFTAAVATYKAAKQNRVNKDEALEDAQTASTSAQSTQIFISGLYTQLTTFSTGALARQLEMSTATTALSSLLSESSIFYAAASCASSPSKTQFNTAVSAATTSLGQAQIDVIDHSAYYASMQSYTDGINAQKVVADANVLTTTTALSVAQQNQVNAVAAEATALAAVIAICPSFAASSVECSCG